MYSFLANSRDGVPQTTSACNTGCCCATGGVIPGETNVVMINYLPWVAPIGGYGLVRGTETTINMLTPATMVPLPNPANQLPRNTDYTFHTSANTTLTASVATNAVDPEAAPMTYTVDMLNAPLNGTVTLNPTTGSFTYIPALNFVGADAFNLLTSDGYNTPVITRVLLLVDGATATIAPLPEPMLAISNGILILNPATKFSLRCSQKATIGDIYRMSIRQPALDCDGRILWNIFCIDWSVLKC